MIREYDGYKDSGIEWIGDIPSNWNTIKIKWTTPVKRGASPRPIADPKYFDDEGEFAWVRIADVTASERYLNSTTDQLSELGASLSVKQYPGDLFLSIAGTVGKPIITKIKCCIHDGFVWFPELKTNPEYLFYLFQSGLPFIGLGKVGTQLNLNTETIGNIQIPVSSNQEVDKIVEYLDHQTGLIDTMIEKKQQLIERLKEQRQAIINEAVTKGLNPDAPMKGSGVEWLGEIPEHWEVVKLKYLADVTRGAILRPVDDPNYFDENGAWTYLNISDATKCDKYLYSGKLNLSELGSTKSARVEPDNLIMTASATIGKMFINKIPVCVHDGFIPIRNLKCNINFLYHYLGNPQLYVGIGKSNTQKNIYVDEVKNMFIALPPNDEQEEIYQYLEGQKVNYQTIMEKLEIQLQKLVKYRQSVISEAVTGKIDVRHWEPKTAEAV